MNYILCENCGCNILETNFTIHQLYCSNYMIKCAICQQLYDQNEKQEHENWHIQNTCQKCQEVCFDLQQHQCAFQTINCKFCNKSFQNNTILNHEDQCSQTLQNCNYCQKMIKMKDLDLHQPLCKRNKMPYTCKKCGSIFQNVKELEKHMNFQCAEEIICPFCTLHLHETEKTNHLLFCGSRTLECTFCQKKVLFKDQAEHELDCFRKKNSLNNQEALERQFTQKLNTVQINCEPDEDDYLEYLEFLQNQQEI